MKRVRTSPRRGAWAVAAAAWAAGAWALSGPKAPEVNTHLMVAADMSSRVVTLRSADASGVTYEDAEGARHVAAWGAALAWRLIEVPSVGVDDAEGVEGADTGGTPVPPVPRAWLVLTDGQRYPGRPVARSEAGIPAGDVAVWSHARLGEIRVPLDEVRRVEFGAMDVGPGAAGQDTVLLKNGDRVQGFVERVGASVEVSVRGERREFRVEDVRTVVMASAERSASGFRAWMTDGTVAALAVAPTLSGSAWTLTPARSGGQAVNVPVEAVRAVMADAGRVTPLSSLAPASVERIGDRRWLPPVRAIVGAEDTAWLGAADLEIPGPMAVRWVLPKGGARRLTAEAELPRSARAWGDCVLVVKVNGREAFRRRLNEGSPRCVVAAEIPEVGPGAGSELEIRVEPGSFGPIQDTVVLRRPLLLSDGE